MKASEQMTTMSAEHKKMMEELHKQAMHAADHSAKTLALIKKMMMEK